MLPCGQYHEVRAKRLRIEGIGSQPETHPGLLERAKPGSAISDHAQSVCCGSECSRVASSVNEATDLLTTERLLTLLTQPQRAQYLLVARPRNGTQVLEQTIALADHHQQAAPAGMIFLVSLQVFRQILDACRQNGNLDFRTSRIRRSTAKGLDDASLLISCDCHCLPANLPSEKFFYDPRSNYGFSPHHSHVR